eukprot:9473735-Pyramimonas_sp.AAC.1
MGTPRALISAPAGPTPRPASPARSPWGTSPPGSAGAPTPRRPAAGPPGRHPSATPLRLYGAPPACGNY